MSHFQWYADKYKCSLVEAFCDRDEPLTAEQIIKFWKEDTGNNITEKELQACNPDSLKVVNYENSRYRD